MGERRSMQMAPLMLACPHRRSSVALLMLLCEVSMLQMKGKIEMLYCTGNHVLRLQQLSNSCGWCFLVFSKVWGVFLLFLLLLFVNTGSVFSAPSSHWHCRRLQSLSSQASLGNTSFIAVSLNDIQQRYLFFLNKIYLAPLQGSAFSLYSLNFPRGPTFPDCLHSQLWPEQPAAKYISLHRELPAIPFLSVCSRNWALCIILYSH